MEIEPQNFGDLSYPTPQLKRMLDSEMLFFRVGDELVDAMIAELNRRVPEEMV